MLKLKLKMNQKHKTAQTRKGAVDAFVLNTGEAGGIQCFLSFSYSWGFFRLDLLTSHLMLPTGFSYWTFLTGVSSWNIYWIFPNGLFSLDFSQWLFWIFALDFSDWTFLTGFSYLKFLKIGPLSIITPQCVWAYYAQGPDITRLHFFLMLPHGVAWTCSGFKLIDDRGI